MKDLLSKEAAILEKGYQEMAADVEREKEALEWIEGTSIG